MLRLLANLVAMALEAGAAVVAAAAAYYYPFLFAAATTAAALALGARLEYLRLVNELVFYFGDGRTRSRIVVGMVAAGEAVFKALLAGVASVFTFSGTDSGRLLLVATVFGVCVWIGANVLRWLAIRFNARPARWGFFRLVAPLGFLFSLGIGLLAEARLLATPTLGDLGKRLVLELPARPGIGQVSEFLFLIKQYFDGLIVSLLAVPFGTEVAKAIGILVSVNMLAGFVISIYAVLISEIVRAMEERLG